MNIKQYIVLAKKTIRSEWQVIFASSNTDDEDYKQALDVWTKFKGYKCIVLKSQAGSFITEREVTK